MMDYPPSLLSPAPALTDEATLEATLECLLKHVLLEMEGSSYTDEDLFEIHCNHTNGVAQLSGQYRLEDYRRDSSKACLTSHYARKVVFNRGSYELTVCHFGGDRNGAIGSRNQVDCDRDQARF